MMSQFARIEINGLDRCGAGLPDPPLIAFPRAPATANPLASSTGLMDSQCSLFARPILDPVKAGEPQFYKIPDLSFAYTYGSSKRSS
jgi:hypothetical protein